MNTIKIEGQVRKTTGQRNAKDLRNEGRIPCTLYGGSETISFSLGKKDLKGIVYTPEFNVAAINLDGKEHKAVVKELQFHPTTDELRHVDFMELVDGKTITLELPVKFVGTSIGVREGGKFISKMRKLKVKLKPENLVGHLEVNISDLSLGKTIRVGDLSYNGIEIMTSPNIPVCSAIIPRVVKEETTTAAAPAAAAASPAAASAAKAPEKKK